MSSPLIIVALLSGALQIEEGASFGFDRVDLLSEDPSTLLVYDLPYAGIFPTGTAIRFITQVKLSWRTPINGLYIGTSLRSQSAVFEIPIFQSDKTGLYCTTGMQTRLLMPSGFLGGFAFRYGYFRIGAGISVLSHAAWSNINWSSWKILPAAGVGIGRRYEGT